MELRPGTVQNNNSILAQFLLFLRRYNLYFRNINEEIVCCYIEVLTDRLRSPMSVRNYIGALGATYVRMGLDAAHFQHHRVRQALKAVDKNVKHIPLPSQIVTPEILRSIVFLLAGSPEFVSLRFLVIAMYMTLLRQSNFCAQTCIKFDHTRQLTRCDVQVRGDNLYFRIKWEKNHQNPTANELVIPATSDPLLCPIRAYSRMLRVIPTSRQHDPLIMFQNRNNISISFV